MDALTLDQIQIFLAIVDEGSFSKAAKRLNRAQSAVTYGMAEMGAIRPTWVNAECPLSRSTPRHQSADWGRHLRATSISGPS